MIGLLFLLQSVLTIDLPAGDVGGFDVDWPIGSSGANRTDYSRGEHDIIRFVGQGRGLTHIRPTVGNTTSADSTIFIGPDAGFVEFWNVSIHCATRKGIHAGLPQPYDPARPTRGPPPFGLTLRAVEVISDQPTDERPISTVWGLLSYSCDVTLEDVDYWLEFSAEHANYFHGFSKHGLVVDNVRIHAVGAEGFKVTNRPIEGLHAPRAWVIIRDTFISNWYQDWSWRGGGGIVIQGGGAGVFLNRIVFKPRILDAPHMKSIMIDDGGLPRDEDGDGIKEAHRYYSWTTGLPSQAPANGPIIIQNVGMEGVGPDWYGLTMRVGTLSPYQQQPVCAGFALKDSGVYGPRTMIQLQTTPDNEGVPRPSFPVTIQSCNGDREAAIAESFGIDTEFETQMPWANFQPLSAGYTYAPATKEKK